MSRHSDEKPPVSKGGDATQERRRLIGLGERSFHKSYYPELRKRLEELERFRTLLNQANDGIMLFKLPEALLVDCNESAAKNMGRSRDDILGRTATEIFDHSSCKCVLATLDSHVVKKSDTQQVLCVDDGLAPERKLRTCPKAMEMTVSRRSIGADLYAVIVARDVSQRMVAEKAVREAEENYRSIFENALEGIYQATMDGRLLSANPALASIFGYESPQALLENVKNLRDDLYAVPEDRAELLNSLERFGMVRDHEVRLRRKDGLRIWVSISARLIRDEKGAPLVVEGFVDDITARREAQDELARLNRQLESKVQERTRDLELKAMELESANEKLLELDAMKNALLSSVSHELRTPLTSVLGFARLIEKDFEKAFAPMAEGSASLEFKTARIRENLEIIRQESERLTRMINDFLDISKIESGRIEWNDCYVLLEHTITGTLQAVRSQLDEKPSVHLEVDVKPSLPALYVDPDRLFQVLHNLLSNAVKFTDQGFIRIRAFEEEQGMVHVVIVDSGTGIPENDLENVFIKFHQVRWDQGDGPKPPGTGLGLAICKQIVEHYDGRIWAEKSEIGGAEIHFTLPGTGSWPAANC